jgi:hypothetical protein
MKDAILTVRISRTARRRIETAARKEGRSISQWVGRLLESGLASGKAEGGGSGRRKRPLAGTLRGGRVPTLADFADVRADLSSSLGGRRGR